MPLRSMGATGRALAANYFRRPRPAALAGTVVAGSAVLLRQDLRPLVLPRSARSLSSSVAGTESPTSMLRASGCS